MPHAWTAISVCSERGSRSGRRKLGRRRGDDAARHGGRRRWRAGPPSARGAPRGRDAQLRDLADPQGPHGWAKSTRPCGPKWWLAPTADGSFVAFQHEVLGPPNTTRPRCSRSAPSSYSASNIVHVSPGSPDASRYSLPP